MEQKVDELNNKIYKLYHKTLARNNNKKELLESGKFLEYYEIFGEDSYNKHFKYIQKKDIERELGIKINFFNVPLLALENNFKVIKEKIFKGTFYLSYYLMCILMPLPLSFAIGNVENNLIYADNIHEYNQEIEQYAEYIRSLNLSDFEIVMKVMNDMWSNIEGYKEPTSFDETGIWRLSLYETGYGVCRNMADDYMARLNAINPTYNATNLDVNLEVESNNMIDNLFGNHMVTCITIDDEMSLIVDPTNKKIGVFKDGEIYMFSKEEFNLKLPMLNQTYHSFKQQIRVSEEFIKSFSINVTYEELMDKYGITAQDEVQQNIKRLDTTHYHIKK